MWDIGVVSSDSKRVTHRQRWMGAHSRHIRGTVQPTLDAMAVDDALINKLTWKIPNALGVDNSAVTHRLISASSAFTVNLWSSEDTKPFVKFSKPAIDDGETLNGRPVRAATTGAPVFDEALAWMDCEVRHTLDLGTHTLFVGEIVDAAINDDESRAAAMSDTRMKYGGVKRH